MTSSPVERKNKWPQEEGGGGDSPQLAVRTGMCHPKGRTIRKVMEGVGPKQKKVPASKNQVKKNRATSCNIRKKVDKPPKKILAPLGHRKKNSSSSGKSHPSHHFSNGLSQIRNGFQTN